MALTLYMDQHVPRAITEGLRLRDVDVQTTYEDSGDLLEDPALLDRAGELDRVLFSQDADLLAEADRRQNENQSFVGVVYAHQLRCSIGACVRDLELLAKLCDPVELAGRVVHLPL